MSGLSVCFPGSWDQVVADLVEGGSTANVMAGGTDLLPSIYRRQLSPRRLISINRVKEARAIARRLDGLIIASGATLAALEEACLPPEAESMPKVAPGGIGPSVSGAPVTAWGVLSQAAGVVGSAQIRNRGTIGGNICNASPAADTIPPLLVLNASVRIVGPEGPRKLPISEFILGPGKTALASGEVLREILVPNTPPKFRALYIKFGRLRSMDLAVVGVAVGLVLSEKRTVDDVRIAVCAASPVPFRATTAEDVLRGSALTGEKVTVASRLVAQETRPITDVRASGEFRRELTQVLVQRAINTITGGAVS